MIDEKLIVKMIENGLPLTAKYPFRELASRHHIKEEDLLEAINQLLDEKKIKRFGPVISNRKVGINQNAMVTLKVNPENLEAMGAKISQYQFVTLCYERKPIKGYWDYNLYFMVHGCDREVVKSQIAQVLTDLNIPVDDCNILFSRQCFKQKGASY